LWTYIIDDYRTGTRLFLLSVLWIGQYVYTILLANKLVDEQIEEEFGEDVFELSGAQKDEE